MPLSAFRRQPDAVAAAAGPDHPGVSSFFMLRCEDDLRTFSLGLPYRFRIAARPKIGSVRIFERDAPTALMLHLADDWDAARVWLAHSTGLSGAYAVEVTADELAADHVEGRTAA